MIPIAAAMIASAFGWTRDEKSFDSAAEQMNGTDAKLLTLAIREAAKSYKNSKLTVVLAESTGTMKSRGFLLSPSDDQMTSPLLANLHRRNMRPFVLTKPVESDGVRIAGEDWLRKAGEFGKPQPDTAYVSMWLPGISPDGLEAVVYAWYWSESGDYADGYGAYFCFKKTDGGWRFVGEQMAWIT
jgi:hypothetical protein